MYCWVSTREGRGSSQRASKVAWIAGPAGRLAIAKDRRTLFLRPDPNLTDRDYLLHVFAEISKLPGVAGLFDRKHNPLYSLQPTAQGAAKIVEFFQKTDILILPSWEEPFGIVLLEAMATGIPVIATGRGGPLDIISSPLEGVLVPPRNPGALANAIQSLATDDERRMTIIRNARERVEKHFDIRTVVPKIEELYTELATKRQKTL